MTTSNDSRGDLEGEEGLGGKGRQGREGDEDEEGEWDEGELTGELAVPRFSRRVG